MTGEPVTDILPFENAEALAALHHRCFDRPWTAESFTNLLAAQWRVALAATDTNAQGKGDATGGKDRLHGFILLQHVADEAEVLTLAVAPEARRTGLAMRLLTAATDWLRARGVQHWHLEVAADNQPALALYRRFGCVETGRRPAYYENVDAVLMQRDLSNQL